jgi:hypothetical protein
VTLCSDTIESNSAIGGPGAPGVPAGTGYGGGLYIYSGITVYIDSATIIANNTADVSPDIDGSYILQNC